MSQQEFDTYLSLLCRLLRIAPQQREQVAEEFRTHMEDRLEDLLSSGMGREEAVKLDLEEFGDAAGLAAQIASISQGRRKRWIMRIGTVSVAGLAAAGLLAVALWPEGARVQVPQVVAQSDEKPKEPTKTKVVARAEETVEEKLAQRIDADYSETPLKEVLEDLRERGGLQIYINAKAINAALPEALSVPITINLKQVRLDMVLDLVLEQAADSQLAYVERDGILIISTGDALSGASEVKVYNCRDLLAMASPMPMVQGMMGGWGPMGAGGGMPGLPGGSGGFGLPGLPGAEAPPKDPQLPDDSPRTTPPPGGSSPRIPSRTKGAPPPSESSIQMLPKSIHAQFGGGGGFMGGGAAPAGGAAAAPDGGGPMLAGGGMGNGGPAPPRTDEEIRAERLMHLITTAVKPDSWQDRGGFGTISEYKGLIVINHNARTHKEVENVLKMLREAAGLPDSGPVGGMMGPMMPGGMPPPTGGAPSGGGPPPRR